MNRADFYYLDQDRAKLYCLQHLPGDFKETKRMCALYEGDRFCDYELAQERLEKRLNVLLGS